MQMKDRSQFGCPGWFSGAGGIKNPFTQAFTRFRVRFTLTRGLTRYSESRLN